MITRFAIFTFDSDRRLVLDERSQPLHVTPKAFDLLALLIGEAPRVVSKVELHERLWPGTFVADATLVGLVKELRRVLDDRNPRARVIRTSHGVGYAFNAELVGVGGAADVSGQWVVANGRRIPLRAGENMIGRDPHSAVWLNIPGVSRRHARIVVTDGQARIDDLGSKNGTVVRGVRIAAAVALRDGDTIVIGPMAIEFRVSDASMSTETVTV
jgi:DNA-binding winged helix-turn-helix (wHTH) protein